MPKYKSIGRRFVAAQKNRRNTARRKARQIMQDRQAAKSDGKREGAR